MTYWTGTINLTLEVTTDIGEDWEADSEAEAIEKYRNHIYDIMQTDADALWDWAQIDVNTT